MTRMGRRHRPFFRINAIDSHAPRDGRILEKLGHVDPLEKDPAKEVVLNTERIQYWLDKGAIPSESVSEILLRKGIKHKHLKEKSARRQRARAIARAAGRPFTKTEKAAKAAAGKAAAEEKLSAEKAAAGKAAAKEKSTAKEAPAGKAPSAEVSPPAKEAAAVKEAVPAKEAAPAQAPPQEEAKTETAAQDQAKTEPAAQEQSEPQEKAQ
jgi:small subunit ribosomal protein S16